MVSGRMPEAALPQLYSDCVHAFVVCFVVVCTTVLAFNGDVGADIISAVLGGAIGYAAGRAGPVSRNTPTRAGDQEEGQE